MKFSKAAAQRNQTLVTEFVLQGFSDLSSLLQLFLFALFLVIYVMTLLGNTIIILIATVDTQLYTPMYFFLRNLSFLELCYISTTVPKMLVNFLVKDRSLSLIGCAVQLYFFSFLGTTDCFLLAVMAYDRYIAISSPLHYTVIMRWKLCIELAATSWIIGILVAFGQTIFIFSLPFCGSNVINHFFCDFPPLLKLACGDTYGNEVTIFLAGVFVLLMPCLLILFSYAQILATILRIRSAVGRQKAFSTCASHLTSVSLFFGTALFMYLRPKSSHSAESDKILSLLYCVITPLLNPAIYTLKNKEVKRALRKSLGGKESICMRQTKG
ncbi:olfactory receptor 10A4-like [Rhinatrema bivittatum]|uniref:olfactory receptor 10A4-like n=1 Tax=Rhinatrema bivittatum TaxID=194408 RepID=UPI001128EC69|nr:olfactory receptor 10A4-like [Rhinatrema bivittatum]